MDKINKKIIGNRLWSFGFKNYQDYLQSWYWADKKKLILELKGNKCEKCGKTKSLQVHHLTYDSLCNENQHDVEVLCKKCHEEAHNG